MTYTVKGQIKNPCKLLIYKGIIFLLVAETGEISNLDLIQDIDKIVKLVEVLSM